MRIMGDKAGPVFVATRGAVTGFGPGQWRLPHFLNSDAVATEGQPSALAGLVVAQIAPVLLNIAPTTTFVFVPGLGRDEGGGEVRWGTPWGRYYGDHDTAIVSTALGGAEMLSVALHEAMHAAWDRLSPEDRAIVLGAVDGPRSVRFGDSYLDDPEERAARVFAGFGVAVLTGNQRPTPAWWTGHRQTLHVFYELLTGTYCAARPPLWRRVLSDLRSMATLAAGWFRG